MEDQASNTSRLLQSGSDSSHDSGITDSYDNSISYSTYGSIQPSELLLTEDEVSVLEQLWQDSAISPHEIARGSLVEFIVELITCFDRVDDVEPHLDIDLLRILFRGRGDKFLSSYHNFMSSCNQLTFFSSPAIVDLSFKVIKCIDEQASSHPTPANK